MTAPRGLGRDPFDAMFDNAAGDEQPTPARPANSRSPTASRQARAQSPRSTRATFHLPEELVEQARDAVDALSGPPLRLTLGRLATDALRAQLKQLQDEHNDGKPFPRRPQELRGGRRPIGS